jgi:hypothetical protein
MNRHSSAQWTLRSTSLGLMRALGVSEGSMISADPWANWGGSPKGGRLQNQVSLAIIVTSDDYGEVAVWGDH